MSKQLQAVVETTVTGLGYELVDLEIAGRGLLRVFIDHPVRAGDAQAESAPAPTGNAAAAVGADDTALVASADALPPGIAVADCEVVSRQLTRVFEVEGIDYARLEVSSPGLDRPLKRPADFERFAGERISLKLREPIEGRRNFEGVLRSAAEGRLELEFEGKAGPQVLSFVIDDVDKARLVPRIEF